MQSNTPDISIVIPIYNSADIIPELLKRIGKAMMGMNMTYEIILSDDCSTDQSWAVIVENCKTNKQVKAIQLSVNTGQWANTLAGISMAGGKYIVTIDDDLEYDPADLKNLYDHLVTGEHNIVFGIAKEKYLHQGKSYLFSSMRKKLLILFWRTHLTDSYKFFYRELVFDGDVFRPNILLDAYLSHATDSTRWGYCPVTFQRRFSGASNHTIFQKVKLFLLYTTHYWSGPLMEIFFPLVKRPYKISESVGFAQRSSVTGL